nr:MAG TPA: hypothetical protein [Caudoviricetes sp.]
MQTKQISLCFSKSLPLCGGLFCCLVYNDLKGSS